MRHLTTISDETDSAALRRRFLKVRAHTEHLSASLTQEDQCVQSMPDASPAKWHRAHTTWFFETFVLLPHVAGYQVHDPRFQVLFNSYYVSVGARHPRPSRGLLTRPGAEEVGDYRRAVERAVLDVLDLLPEAALGLIELGLQHEQQHQELLLTDILHAFAQNPLAPACLPLWREPDPAPGPTRFLDAPGGITHLGARAERFAFDNETPVHRVLLEPYRLASRLVRNAEFQAFIDDGGYETPALWMSDGWDTVRAEAWIAPLYWRRAAPDAPFAQFTPAGLQPIDPDAPVRHVSWYEADAYARWAGGRLPTEAELEHAATAALAGFHEFTGHVWQWTQSAYSPYPRFRAAPGAVGEYNGKFMINQMVLRGGSAATPPEHARPTYRNFFAPDKRWQFSGLRLARD